jgi:hypothetical protein
MCYTLLMRGDVVVCLEDEMVQPNNKDRRNSSTTAEPSDDSAGLSLPQGEVCRADNHRSVRERFPEGTEVTNSKGQAYLVMQYFFNNNERKHCVTLYGNGIRKWVSIGNLDYWRKTNTISEEVKKSISTRFKAHELIIKAALEWYATEDGKHYATSQLVPNLSDSSFKSRLLKNLEVQVMGNLESSGFMADKEGVEKVVHGFLLTTATSHRKKNDSKRQK